MNDLSLDLISIRALAWLSSRCLLHYCSEKNIVDIDVQAFCRHMEELPSSLDIPAWEKRLMSLKYHGLGDDAPADEKLAALIEAASEIVGSQLYSAWSPVQAHHFTHQVLTRSGYALNADLLQQLRAHNPESGGWGSPIDPITLAQWSCSA